MRIVKQPKIIPSISIFFGLRYEIFGLQPLNLLINGNYLSFKGISPQISQTFLNLKSNHFLLHLSEILIQILMFFTSLLLNFIPSCLICNLLNKLFRIKKLDEHLLLFCKCQSLIQSNLIERFIKQPQLLRFIEIIKLFYTLNLLHRFLKFVLLSVYL